MKILKPFFLMLLIISCSDDDNTKSMPKIDLQADEMDIVIASGLSSIQEITIVGIVKNVGDDFLSNEGKQSIVLYQRPLGIPETEFGQEVTRVNFTSLKANETLEVSYTLNWNTSVEFPPEYILKIEYIDTLIDDNIHNDDINSKNDSLIISGYDIHDLF